MCVTLGHRDFRWDAGWARERGIFYFFPWGGTSKHDGQSGVPHMGANQSNVSIEMIESKYPIRINKYGFIKNTGGPGKYRGGLGLIREYEILSDAASLNVRSDKRKFPPHGLFGGKNGSKSYNIINPNSQRRILPVLMTEVEKLKKGDIYSHEMSGGGGYGEPIERVESLVLKDIIEDKVDIKIAESEYGVAVIKDNFGNLTVDKKRTRLLRNKLSSNSSSII